ncbi:acyltransferase family protein [Microbacter sp. GSS18]|nr:acyltransferase family protein [Microbacter sp. GSS18]
MATAFDVGSRTSNASPSGFIAELQGLRGVALTLVVVFHLLGAGRVSGGVDVFLFVTGFLAAREVLSRFGRPGFSVTRHYSRAASRLFPSATVVLLAVGVATVAVLPATRWIDVGRELAASAFYYQNWQLIETGLAYGAVSSAADPLQHFWSLAIQGQFLLLWPIVVLATLALARADRGLAGRILITVTALATAGSFAYAMWFVRVDQMVAYFDSFTRFWEIGAGALLGLVATRLRFGARTRSLLAMVGLAMVISSGFLFDGGSLFPGPAALWPVGGAALIVLAAGDRGPAGRILTSRPLVWLADLSYPLYLWHWPVAVFYVASRGHPELGTVGAFVVLGISLVLSILTYHLLERPVVRLRPRVSPRRLLTMTAVPLVVVGSTALAGVFAMTAVIDRERAAVSEPSAGHPGAAAAPQAGAVSEFRPSAWFAAHDDILVDGHECPRAPDRTTLGQEAVVCEIVQPEDATLDVLLLGGSHTEHWIPAWEVVAEDESWHLSAVVKHACRWGLAESGDDARPCRAWSANVTEALRTDPPDVVVVILTWTTVHNGEVAPPADQVEGWRWLVEMGVSVVGIRDTPRFLQPVPECVLAADVIADCARPANEIFGDLDALLADADVPEDIAVLDLSDALCTTMQCVPVIGDVLAYRDRNHFTNTFASTLAVPLRAALAACRDDALEHASLCVSASPR